MQYAMNHQAVIVSDKKIGLADWNQLVSGYIKDIKMIKQDLGYNDAVNYAKNVLAFFRQNVKNFGERSFVAALSSTIQIKDLYSHPVTE